MDPKSAASLDLRSFYPKELDIQGIDETDEEITIHMHSASRTCHCHKCGAELVKHHGSHHRSVQDLPILGKRVRLDIQAYDYECTCGEKGRFAAAETFDGFIDYNSRKTERLADFICILALETSCESCAKILNCHNVKISGDTVINLLKKRYSGMRAQECGPVVGIDDFSFKKRQTYGTIIVDGETHKPVAILEGRDGETLKEWLGKNKHIRTVTRDRASAYAKAIEEVLPDCMQIADRFHLHQNLLSAVNKIIGREIPASIAIPECTDGTILPAPGTIAAQSACGLSTPEGAEPKETF